MHRLDLTPELARYLNNPGCNDGCHYDRADWKFRLLGGCHVADPSAAKDSAAQPCTCARKVIILGNAGNFYAIVHDANRIAAGFQWQVATTGSRKLLEAVKKCLTAEERRENFMLSARNLTLAELAGTYGSTRCWRDGNNCAAFRDLSGGVRKKLLKMKRDAGRLPPDDFTGITRKLYLHRERPELWFPTTTDKAKALDARFGPTEDDGWSFVKVEECDGMQGFE